MKMKMVGIGLVILSLASGAWAQNADSSSSAAASSPGQGGVKSGGDSGGVTATSPQYVLQPGDVVQVKVYQEEDLTAVSRIGKDGTLRAMLA